MSPSLDGRVVYCILLFSPTIFNQRNTLIIARGPRKCQVRGPHPPATTANPSTTTCPSSWPPSSSKSVKIPCCEEGLQVNRRHFHTCPFSGLRQPTRHPSSLMAVIACCRLTKGKPFLVSHRQVNLDFLPLIAMVSAATETVTMATRRTPGGGASGP